MKPASRLFRWLPRFSLSNLLMLMVVVGLSLAWYDQRRKLGEQAAVIENQRLEITRFAVNNVLRWTAPDSEKGWELHRYVQLFEPMAEIDKRFGLRASEQVVGEHVLQVRYEGCDLVVQCDANGIVNELGYVKMHNPEHPVLRWGEYKTLVWTGFPFPCVATKSRELNESP